MSSPGLPDADASRPRSGILTPSSDGSLHRRHDEGGGFSAEPQRRRSGSGVMDQLLKLSIAVKPHPPDLHVKPRALQPLMLLPRKHLSFGCLDLGDSSGELPRSRFYECHVKILDLEGRMGTTQSVVIARSESKDAIYALERQTTGLYVICKLGPWADLDGLSRFATVLSPELSNASDSSSKKPVPDTSLAKPPPIFKEHKKKRAAIDAIQTLVRKRPRSATDFPPIDTIKQEQPDTPGIATQPASAEGTTTGHQEPVSNTDVAPATDNNDQGAPQQSTEVILETIRTQYLEALYKSKGSLAYFAKGPLSRARSTFHLDLESNLDMNDLIEFLKSMVLTTVQIDKKYRETIPELFSKSSIMVDSSDEARKRRKRPKKMKVGKDAMYPTENDLVGAWWATHKPELKEGQNAVPASEIRSHASVLRTRETQLQMILILEILALEPLKAPEDTTEASLPDLPGAPSQQSQMAPPPKKRSKHNFPVLLDVHADRLTIWQSTASDDHLWGPESQAATSVDSQELQNTSSEPLKDFCVDVIVPFFSARLPQLCDSISKKLGGPLIVSPPKSGKSKQSSSSKTQRPGSIAKRQAVAKPPRTLQRALSTEQQHRRSVSRGPGNMIALMRSASSTAVAGIKREGSEPVPAGDATSTRAGRVGLSRSSSTSSSSVPKRDNKKALVEAELRDAISALRKPNRDVVGKAMAEAADHKASTAQASKKHKKSVRTSMSAVQVEATPANNRFRDVLAAKSDNIADLPLASTEDVIPPSSAGNLVPSTGRKAGHQSTFDGGAASFADAIGSTPLKQSAASQFLRRPAEEAAIPLSSPLIGRALSAIQKLSSAGGTSTTRGMGLSQSRDIGVFMTPVKKPTASRELTENIGPSPLAQGKKVSIYDKLGWDDDFDDL